MSAIAHQLRLLLVEDSADDADLILLALRRGGLDPLWKRVETDAALKASLAAGTWDAVLADHTLPEYGSAAALAAVRAADPELPFIVVSGTVGEEAAVGMMRAGANDYILKGSLARLAPAIEREGREAENRRAKRVAEQTAAHLAAVVNFSDDAITSENPDGIIESWNSAAERLHGWTAAEAIGRHISFIVPPDKADELADVMKRLQRGDHFQQFETTRLHRDGTLRHVSITASPILDRDGRVIGVSKVARDFGERTRREAELRESEERFRRQSQVLQSILDNISSGVVVADETGKSLLFNPAAEQILQLGKTDARPDEWQKRYSLFLPPDGVLPFPTANLPMVRALRGESCDGVEMIVKHDRIPQSRWLSVNARPMRDASGDLRGGSIVFQDITEHKRAEIAIRRSEQRYRILVTATAAIIWDCPASGAFDSVQPAWTAFTGQTLEQHSGWGWLNAVHPNDRQKSAHAWAAAVAQRGLYRVEHRIRRADGEFRMMSAWAVPILAAGGAVREWVGIHIDVTDQSRAEEGLRESQERLGVALAASGTGTFRWDIISNALDWDEQLDRLFGLPPGKTPRSLEQFVAMVHTDDRAGVVERCVLCKEQGVDFAMEFRVVRPDGAVRWLDDRGQTFRGGDSRPAYMTGACVDITERKRADEALRASEVEFRTLAESVPQIVWITRPDGGTIYLNQQWMDYSGLTLEESLGKGWIKPFHPDDRQRSVDAWQNAIAKTDKYSIEVRLRRADGVYRWWLVRGVPLLAATGDVVKWFGTCTDIDELKRTETERAELLAQLTLQIERMPLAYLISGPDGRYTCWNPAAERMFGFTAAEILGEFPSGTIVPPQSEAIVADIFARLAAGDMNAHGMCENITKDGRMIECEWHNTPLFNSDGVFQGVLSLAQDITARQLAEKALHLRDRAIQVATQGFLITDPAQPDNPSIYVSPGFERMTGYASEEVLGRNCRILQGKDTDPAAVAQVRRAIRTEESCTVELLNYRKDGTSFWNELSVSPVRNADGQVTNFVGVQTDVTARRHLEEQFRQAQKMEAFGQLAGGVAHDFNNLLTIINGYSDLLLQRLPAGDPSRQPIAEILKAGELSAGLTRQLLAFSRQQILAPRILNLNEVVTETDKMLRRLIGEDLRLTTTLASALWAVLADPGQIEQVLLNLSVNARDAMPEGGRLTIETRNVELDETYTRTHAGARAGPHVLLSVTDTGCGMSPEVQARIFEPFYTTKGLGKGTGLGLATVFGIVKQSGGHVTVYSEVGVGTSFKVYLPRVEQPSEVLIAPSRFQAPPRGTETVLLAEDEAGVRNLTSLVLAGCGYKVLAAVDAEGAMRIADGHQGPIHLLITDVVMPGAGGRAVSEQIARQHPKVCVLFISGYTDDAIIRHGVLREGVHFLQKPFSPATLANKVREILDSEQAKGSG